MGKQKRSPNTYQKINTLYKRDINNIIMKGAGFVAPEFEYLRNCLWDATEKIDGTCIRLEIKQIPIIPGVVYTPDMDPSLIQGVEWQLEYKGKTDNANIPKRLMQYLTEYCTEDKILTGLGLSKQMFKEDWVEKGWIESSENPVPCYDKIPKMYTLYGEGYGVGIQKCGGSYLKSENSFIGFDVKVDDMYLLRDNMEEIFAKAGIQTVPYHGLMTIDEAVEKVTSGFVSAISEDRNFIAEGLVLKSPIGLKNRRGERLVVKIKYGDYVKYRNMYGTDDIVEQEDNPKNNING